MSHLYFSLSKKKTKQKTLRHPAVPLSTFSTYSILLPVVSSGFCTVPVTNEVLRKYLLYE